MLGDLPPGQQSAWEALFELHGRLPDHWVLVGGQNVYLHAIERGAPIIRPTTDADMGLDLRGRPGILEEFTRTLTEMGFQSAGRTMTGHEIRWERDTAKFDVLIPRGTGERSYSRKGVTGGTAIEAPGIQSALDRSESAKVSAGAMSGTINRTNIVGALIGKAAAMRIMDDPDRERHLSDALTLISVMSARELRRDDYRQAEKSHLANLCGHLRKNRRIVESFDRGEDHLQRLTTVTRGWNPADPNARRL